MLFDSSLSVGTHGFAAFKKYAVDMIGNMDVGPEKARVCVVVFTFIKKVVFDLKTYNSTKELQNAISRIRFEKVATGINYFTKSVVLFVCFFVCFQLHVEIIDICFATLLDWSA